MSFAVAADAYDRFMGRYSRHLSGQLADLAGVAVGQRVLDVGCGPGALTSELVARVGADRVSAVDPSTSFVEAARARHPGVLVLEAAAEALPFETAAFDAALAQLVVHFMAGPVAGLGEMRRVTRVGGVVAACVWDHASAAGPLGLFWEAARSLDPGVHDESRLAGAREGHLAELFAAAGLASVQSGTIDAAVQHATFEEWWTPFEGGVGPAGGYVATLGAGERIALREECRRRIPTEPFTVTARAWACRGIVPSSQEPL